MSFEDVAATVSSDQTAELVRRCTEANRENELIPHRHVMDGVADADESDPSADTFRLSGGEPGSARRGSLRSGGDSVSSAAAAESTGSKALLTRRSQSSSRMRERRSARVAVPRCPFHPVAAECSCLADVSADDRILLHAFAGNGPLKTTLVKAPSSGVGASAGHAAGSSLPSHPSHACEACAPLWSTEEGENEGEIAMAIDTESSSRASSSIAMRAG